jgi:thymidine kinase
MTGRRGAIELIRGPMFSGKTDELIRRLHEFAGHGLRVTAVKSSTDTRHAPGSLVSHAGARYPANEIDRAEDLGDLSGQSDIIGLDEAQFFDETLVDVVLRLRERGSHIVIAGLDFDFRREPFATVMALSRVADSIETRTATCAICGEPAEFTQRLAKGRPAAIADARFRVGGVGLYEPRCRSCHEAEDAVRQSHPVS